MPRKTETKEELRKKLAACKKELNTKTEVVKEEEKKLKEMEEQIKDYKDRIIRMQADFENYQKAIQKEFEMMQKYANKNLILELLDDMENMELALDKVKDRTDEFYEAINGINHHLWRVLSRYGLKKIEAKGKKFDPFYHEVVVTEKGDGEDGTVLEELKRGYLFYDSLLKPAKVKVLKKGDDQDERKDNRH